MDSELRRRIGARLLQERIQGKDWNELKAARAAAVEPKTIRRIERGQNYEMASLEKYALALGHPLEWWLVEILEKEIRRTYTADSFRDQVDDAPARVRSGERER